VVPAGYISIDVERLRNPMQQISDYLLKYMGIKQTDNVIEPQECTKGERYGS